MRVALSLAAVLAVAIGLNSSAVAPASAWCGWWCRGAVVVPAPVIVPAPVAVVPAPNPIPLPAPAWYGGPRPVYPYYGYSPVYYGTAAAQPGRAIATGAATAGTTPSDGASATSAAPALDRPQWLEVRAGRGNRPLPVVAAPNAIASAR